MFQTAEERSASERVVQAVERHTLSVSVAVTLVVAVVISMVAS